MLREIRFPPYGAAFPFNVPWLRGVEGGEVGLEPPVTILVGENGSGKSTLLEALAWACELPLAGSAASALRDDTLKHVRPLGDALKLSWDQRTRRGFFFRAEDYFGFVKAQNQMKAELRADAERIRRDNAHLPAAELARITGPYLGSVAATEARYGADLDAQSHGESFLAFFKGRLSGPGLYLLDEPEAALSPTRQLAFLALLKDAVGRGAQVIMATHAPMLMAYPGAQCYEIGDDGLQPRAFDELETVRMMRDFLAQPEAFLRHL